VFEDFGFGGFEIHVEEVDSDGGVEGVLFEVSEVLGNGFEGFGVFAVVDGLILKVIDVAATIELVIVVVIAALDKVVFQEDSLEILIVISWGFFMLAIGIVVIVELVVPAAGLVEKVNVLAVLDFEPLAARDLGEDLESTGIGCTVRLHFLESVINLFIIFTYQ
jgi:hypothetical protein